MYNFDNVRLCTEKPKRKQALLIWLKALLIWLKALPIWLKALLIWLKALLRSHLPATGFRTTLKQRQARSSCMAVLDTVEMGDHGQTTL